MQLQFGGGLSVLEDETDVPEAKLSDMTPVDIRAVCQELLDHQHPTLQLFLRTVHRFLHPVLEHVPTHAQYVLSHTRHGFE